MWTYPESPPQGALPQRSCPAVDAQGRVFACMQNTLVALRDAGDRCEVIWQHTTGGHIPGSPTMGPDGNVRVHSGDGFLYIISPTNERVCDPVPVGEPLPWAAPLVDRHNATWICGGQGGLYRVDAEGKKDARPYLRSREKFDSAGLIHNEVFYVGCNNACVVAVPLAEPRGRNRWNPLEGQGKTGWYINAALALARGPTLIVASRDDHLYAFNLDGQAVWSEAMPGPMLGSPVVDERDGIYAGLAIRRSGQPGSGVLVRLDAATHRIQWRYETAAPVESTPVIGDDGVVYFGDNDGTIHAVDANGNLRWKDPLRAAVRSPGTIVAKGRVAFGTDNGQLVVLDCDSQQLMPAGWPKYLGTLHQSAVTEPPPG